MMTEREFAIAAELLGLNPSTVQTRLARGWFTQQWQEETGGDISQEHLALIDRLTQEVGVSDTCGGVAVTLDSVTCGDSILWMLLKVDLSDVREKPALYNFEQVDVTLSPEPDGQDTPGGAAYDYAYVGMAEDGKLTLLLRYAVDLTGEDTLLTGYDVTVSLGSLLDGDSVAVEGAWELSFPLKPTEQEVLTLESAVVPAHDIEHDDQTCTVEIRDIRITAADIRFTQDGADQMLEPQLKNLVLQDGTEIPRTMGSSRWTGEVGTGLWSSDFTWAMPMDLSQVVGVRFGDEIISLR